MRLKTFLEMRGADGGPWSRICALPALWVGLLYDQGALDAAWDLVKDWSMAEREALRNAVPELALDAPLPGGGKLRDIAGEVLDIAHAGLTARARLDAGGQQRDRLPRAAARGRAAPARCRRRCCSIAINGEWGGDISRVYGEMSF